MRNHGCAFFAVLCKVKEIRQVLYMKEAVKKDQEAVTLKQKQGTWRRFFKIFPKCHLPWLLIAFYVALQLGTANMGISETDYTAQLFAGDTSSKLLMTLVTVMIIRLLVNYIAGFFQSLTCAEITKRVRKVVFQKVMRLPVSYFQDDNPKEAVQRIAGNAEVVENTIVLVVIPLITSGYTSFAVFFKIFKYDIRLSLILLVFIPLQIFMAFVFGRINFDLSDKSSFLAAELIERLSEIINHVPMAKSFVREAKEEERGGEYTERLYKLHIRSSWFDQLQSLSTTGVELVQALVISLAGLMLLGTESIRPRAWISFFMFSSVFNGAVEEFIMYYNNLKVIQGGAARLCEIMDAQEEDLTGKDCGNLSGDIRIKNVSFGYDEEQKVLDDFSCTFKDNCINGLFGPSGSGKSTLIRLILRMYQLKEGDIVIGTENVKDYALEQYRDNFTVVSQDAMLFSDTIRANVMYGNGNISDEEIWSALEKAHASEFVKEMSAGLDAVLEEAGKSLSGGQRQKLALARALLSKGHYMILDEPVSQMDAIAAGEFLEILKEISGNRCVILIAHSASALKVTERTVVIENGKAVENADENCPFFRELSERGGQNA